ncbi:hypothetical protein Tco_0004753 [Tanacetum coccineum]
MTRTSKNELVEPYKEPERVLHSIRKLFNTRSLDYSSLPEFDLFFDHESHVEEEITKTMGEPTMEEYMKKTRDDYGLEIARLKFDEKARFEMKGQFLKELRDNTFSGSDNADANEHIERVLEIADLFIVPDVTQDQLMLRIFPISLTGAASIVPMMNAANAKKAIQEMADHSQKWHNKTSTRCRSSDTSDGLAAIQAQLNNLSTDIKKVNEKVYAAQVGSYYTQFGVPFPQRGRYRAVALGFYQRDHGNPSYQKRRQTMEETLRKFMVESAKRHEEHSTLIKEIRASTDVAIRNQRALIKALEIQIGQMSKVLQERGSGSLPVSTKTNLRDHVKSITTIKDIETSSIRRIRPNRYAISNQQKENKMSLTEISRANIPFSG